MLSSTLNVTVGSPQLVPVFTTATTNLIRIVVGISNESHHILVKYVLSIVVSGNDKLDVLNNTGLAPFISVWYIYHFSCCGLVALLVLAVK